MALEVHYNTALPVYWEDPNGVVPASASAVFREADGSIFETLSVTLPTVATTIASATNSSTLTLTSAVGVVVGQRYRVESFGFVAVAVVARIDGSTVYLESGLPTAPEVGDTFAATRMTASIAAPGEGNIGPNYRLEWLYDDGTTEGFGADVVHVVRWKWSTPVDGNEVREYVSRQWSSIARSRTELYYMQVAERANERIRGVVEAAGRRPYLFGASNIFDAAGREAMRWELAKDGLLPVGLNAALFEQDRQEAFNHEMNQAMLSLAMYDRNDDGKIDDEEAAGFFFNVSTSR